MTSKRTNLLGLTKGLCVEESSGINKEKGNSRITKQTTSFCSNIAQEAILYYITLQVANYVYLS